LQLSNANLRRESDRQEEETIEGGKKAREKANEWACDQLRTAPALIMTIGSLEAGKYIVYSIFITPTNINFHSHL